MFRILAMAATLLAGCAISTAIAVEDKPRRVLALVDSVQQEILSPSQKELAGQARIEFPKSGPPGDTGSALARIDEFLGDGKWDVIYFNFGLADLHHKDPKTKEVRALAKSAGGVRVSSPEIYEKNLGALVERLNKTGARLVWASTTPISKPGNYGLFDPGSEVEYNAIAAKIMNERNVPIVDLHAQALANSASKQSRVPTLLYPHAVAAIRAALKP